MWYPITPEHSDIAMEFAHETVDKTFDRMEYGSGGIEERLFNIYIGKIGEQIVHPYLQNELKLNITQDNNVGRPDLFDFKIEFLDRQITGDVKSFYIMRKFGYDIRTPERIKREGSALVPVDQFDKRRKDLYIFTMILADEVREKGYRQLSTTSSGICVMRWATATDIDAWKRIPKGEKIFPYRTRINNYGQKISECKPMEDFLDYLNLPPF